MKVKEIKTFVIQDLGLMDYLEALRLQKETVLNVIAGQEDQLLLCEHPPVLTLGRLAAESNFLISQDDIRKSGMSIERIDRGGEVTLHSPGQLVIYPIFNLQRYGRDLKLFLEKLEQVAIDFLKGFDIMAHRFSGQRGVWVGSQKIASIGIGVKRWVSYHGMAVNVNTNLSRFSVIRPCGLDVEMTSIQKLTGREVAMPQAKEQLILSFAKNFNLE